MTTMYDSVSASSIPRDAPIVGGYDDGRYAWSQADWDLFPNAQHVHITVFGKAGVQVADCEAGDLTPQSAAIWAKAEVIAGRRPTIYCNTSTHPAVVSELAAHGLEFVRDVDWWAAQYDNVAVLVPGSVAKQYQSTNDWDISVTNGVWPARAPAPQPIVEDDMPPFVSLYPGTNGPYYVIAADMTSKVLLQQPEDGTAATTTLKYEVVALSAQQLNAMPTVG